jgi:hypothetical protein
VVFAGQTGCETETKTKIPYIKIDLSRARNEERSLALLSFAPLLATEIQSETISLIVSYGLTCGNT